MRIGWRKTVILFRKGKNKNKKKGKTWKPPYHRPPKRFPCWHVAWNKSSLTYSLSHPSFSWSLLFRTRSIRFWSDFFPLWKKRRERNSEEGKWRKWFLWLIQGGREQKVWKKMSRRWKLKQSCLRTKGRFLGMVLYAV